MSRQTTNAAGGRAVLNNQLAIIIIARLAAALLLAAPAAGQSPAATTIDTTVAAAAPAVQVDSGAVTVRTPPPDALNQFYEDEAFDYGQSAEPPAPSLWARFWSWVQRTLGNAFFGAPAPVRKLIFYGLVAGLLIFAVLRLLGMQPGGALSGAGRSGASVSFKDIEENLHTTDLGPLIDEAVHAGDYRRAVRLLYLRTLQRLAARDLIHWQLDKTNHAFLRELRRTRPEAAPRFADLTLFFDYAWYGDVPLGEDTFARLRRAFVSFDEALDEVPEVA